MKNWMVVLNDGDGREYSLEIRASQLAVEGGCLVFTTSKLVPSRLTGPCAPTVVSQKTVTKAYAAGEWIRVTEQPR